MTKLNDNTMASCPEVKENLGSFGGPVPEGSKIGIDVLTSTIYVKGNNNQWTPATSGGGSSGPSPSALINETIGVSLDGGGSILTTGQKGYIKIPYNCTIISWSIITKEIGSISFDVWRSTTKPTVANSITASSKPSLTSLDTGSSSTLTGWNTTITSGDIIGWNLDTVSSVTWAVLQLIVKRV